MSMDALLTKFNEIACNPAKQLKDYKAKGLKAIGCMPYYVPEELVYAGGMVPFGMWGSNNKTITKAKEYCATFYCTIAQLDLEMLLDGTMDLLDGVITPTICDTLRPMSQNIRVSMSEKMPVIFLAHPQNRFADYGLKFTASQYTNVRKELEAIRGSEITDDEIREAIKVYNVSRRERRRFVKLAAKHADVITARKRCDVLKASYFMLKNEYNDMLIELNNELEALPVCNWKGAKIVTSGIICDNPTLLKIFEDNNIAIVADDVAHESRSFRVDCPETAGDPMMALAMQFAAQDYDVLLFDPQSNKNRRGEFVADLCKSSGADGLVLFMQQFCDPEEMEYPSLRQALNEAGVKHIKLGIDQQMRDFGQAATAIEAFAETL